MPFDEAHQRQLFAYMYARAAAGLWPVWMGVWLALRLLFAGRGGLASISVASFCLLGALGVFLRAVATRLDSLAAPPRIAATSFLIVC